MKGWNRVNSIKYPNNEKILVEAPEVTQFCSGASAVHDIQLSQLPQGSFTTLVEPQPIFKYVKYLAILIYIKLPCINILI